MGQRTNSDAPASQADAGPGAEPGAASADTGGEDAAEAPDGEAQASPDVAPGEPQEPQAQDAQDTQDAQADQEAQDTQDAQDAQDAQEDLWRGQTARAWHERTWLRVLAVLVVLTGIAAIVPYPLRITSECTIIPRERVKVRAEIPGVISEILVDEGQAVKKGDALARIDDRALAAEQRRLAEELDRLQREREPLHTASPPGSPQPAAGASAAPRHEADERPGQPEAPDAAIKRARAELASVEERLAMTTVRAPLDGEILTPRLREHLHEAVEAGGLVCEIANTRRMRAEILVPERETDAIAVGMPAVVKVEAYPTHPFEGKVDFIAPAVDSETRRIRVVVELDNEAGLLKANMTGFGEIEADKRSLLNLATRRVLRWIRVRFLL